MFSFLCNVNCIYRNTESSENLIKQPKHNTYDIYKFNEKAMYFKFRLYHTLPKKNYNNIGFKRINAI